MVRKQGALEGYAVGGCCDLSTSVHHLVEKLGEELGYIMAADTGWDVEDCIPAVLHGDWPQASYALPRVSGATITNMLSRA